MTKQQIIEDIKELILAQNPEQEIFLPITKEDIVWIKQRFKDKPTETDKIIDAIHTKLSPSVDEYRRSMLTEALIHMGLSDSVGCINARDLSNLRLFIKVNYDIKPDYENLINCLHEQ